MSICCVTLLLMQVCAGMQLPCSPYLAHVLHAADHLDPGDSASFQCTASTFTQQVNLKADNTSKYTLRVPALRRLRENKGNK